MAGDLEWKAAEVVAVLGWLAVPVITFFLPKILSCLGFDASKKLMVLEIHIIPELKKTMRAVEEEAMLRRGDTEADIDVVAALDRMDRMLRHAREEVEDIFDDQEEIQLYRFRFLRRLRGAVETCIARCLGIVRIVCKGSTRLMQWLRRTSLCPFILHRSGKPAPVTPDNSVSIDIAASVGPVMVATRAAASDESVPVAAPSGWWRSCLCSSFDLSKNCFRSIHLRIVDAFKAACTYRDWSYDVVGITSYQNATAFDFVLTAIPRRSLKKRIEKVESTVSEVKKYLLLGTASNSTPNDIANKNRSRIRTASKRKVFGREALRENIMAKLRETSPSSGTSPCYSVIGIYGVAGSGKTTFAQYTRDYIEEECKEEKLFDTIMCIHVSKTFSVDDIFHEMLKDITGDRHSNISYREELEEKLKKELRGKCFLLILDDLWVKTKNDPQLEELISPLNVGMKGSKILVTARTKVATRALCDDEPTEMPDLDEDLYFSMFMHYALGGTSVADEEEFIRVGRVIAEKLHQSPIAAVAVAGRLGINPDIKFWKKTAKHGKLNDTMDALWWSYQPLNPDIKRCFEFCNILPRRSKLRRDELVRLWIAQGFVKTSSSTEDMEDVAEGYIQELVSCSFLQPGVDDYSIDYFTIHDLLHDLLAKVAGSDCFRIENSKCQRGESWKGDVPRDVRHLFILNYDAKLIAEKILGLKNLRTLIIYVVEGDTSVEEKVIESICKRLSKLRVLAVAFSQEHGEIKQPNKFRVPESISQLKYLRYLAFRTSYSCTVILPSALNKCHHIQLLDFGHYYNLEFTFGDLVNLRHIICHCAKVPEIGRLISLQTIPRFTVRNEQGHEVKQLMDLNKLRGILRVDGLEHVKSKEEANEANLAAKERLTELILVWDDVDTRCSPEVEAEVLEGLRPPMGLETLDIYGYKGSRYPDWMVGNQNDGRNNLQELNLWEWSQLGPGPELGAFAHLRGLKLWDCSWDTLPSNMEHLTSLKRLDIIRCENVQSLQTLPQSLKRFNLFSCGYELMKSCQTEGHPNWQKIEHIPYKTFEDTFM